MARVKGHLKFFPEECPRGWAVTFLTKCFKAPPCMYEFFSYLRNYDHFALDFFWLSVFFFWTIIILSTAFVTIGLSVRLTVFGWTELLECSTESRQRTPKKTQPEN